MFSLNTITAEAAAGKTVLMRVDFNVPLREKNGKWVVADARRIERALPTIKLLLENKCRVRLISHLGRPKSSSDTKFSLKVVADYCKDTYGLPINFLPGLIELSIKKNLEEQQPGTVVMLENLRFYSGEKENDAAFSHALASLGDIYINEAFSACHRQHASVVGVTHELPTFAGLALTTEVMALQDLLENPAKPFVVILGGAKISDKVAALKNLSRIADIVLIGGAAANTFLKAEGYEIYRSFVEEKNAGMTTAKDYTKVARRILAEHKQEKILKDGYIPLPKILYPVDVVAAPSLETHRQKSAKVIDLSHGMADQDESEQLFYLDIGPKTIQLYTEIIAKAGTVFWNGPMGVWENPLFEAGTKAISKAVARSTGKTVIGGGDTISAAHHFHLDHKFSYVSAAGGAALDLLGGDMLPGLRPLIHT